MMKVGDLVRFCTYGNPNGGPIGLIIGTAGCAELRSLNIKWFCEFTPDGFWGSNLFKVISENR